MSSDLITLIYSIAIMAFDFVALMIFLIYFIGHYAHPEDSKFGGSMLARFIIFIGFFLSYAFVLTI